MEWAKTHTKEPLPIELGFSGARAPRGRIWREYGSGHPELERLVARRYGVARERVYLAGGTSLANFVAIAAFCDPGDVVAVEIPRYASLSEIPRSLGARITDLPRRPAGRLGRWPEEADLVVVTNPHNPSGRNLSREDWADLDAAAERGAIVVVDEVYRDLQARRLSTLKVREIPSGYDAAQFVTERLSVTVRDGVQVPISLVYHKDTALDGTAHPFRLRRDQRQPQNQQDQAERERRRQERGHGARQNAEPAERQDDDPAQNVRFASHTLDLAPQEVRIRGPGPGGVCMAQGLHTCQRRAVS